MSRIGEFITHLTVKSYEHVAMTEAWKGEHWKHKTYNFRFDIITLYAAYYLSMYINMFDYCS